MTRPHRPTAARNTAKGAAAATRTAAEPGQLRLIGGQWRGRKLIFPAVAGLRPSPDRVRETLFNWLMQTIAGARCLDLFAGSGALGLEALSRGASHCTFVDASPAAIRAIADHLRTLHCETGSPINGDALGWLQRTPPQPFDIVFLDPPFRSDLLGTCAALLENGWLAPQAWIYIEAARDETLPVLPPNWRLHRDRSAGKVAYRLFEREGE